jgi:restriction system protein
MQYTMADPRIVDPVDIISDIDKRPNLLELTPKEFEDFIQNLFAKMGYDTKLYRATGDGGIDCVAYDPHPITGGKFVVQAKLYTRTVQPTHVRDLWGTKQHEGATKGIMITTSGYGPDSYKFAGGKPLSLIDGSGLLSLCKQNDIPARILPGRKRRSPDGLNSSCCCFSWYRSGVTDMVPLAMSGCLNRPRLALAHRASCAARLCGGVT